LIILAYILFAPVVGGFLSGLDRKLSAKMQGRVGPPLLQPFYDVFKLLTKENLLVSKSQDFFIICFFVFIVFTGALFFNGNDALLIIFSLTLANIYLILGAYASNSPYSHMGAEREMIQIMAYEPMMLLTLVGMYMVTGSFQVSGIAAFDKPLIYFLPGIFIGFMFILGIKFRKSPFDLSMSHHRRQNHATQRAGCFYSCCIDRFYTVFNHKRNTKVTRHRGIRGTTATNCAHHCGCENRY
jgi:ech hydrogenase subunit B